MCRPAGLTFPARQVPQPQLPGGIRGDQAGQRLGVFGQTGQTVSVSVQRAQERLSEDPLQLDGVHGPLIFPLSLERMQLRTANVGSENIQYSTAAFILIVSVQFVDVVLGFPDIILGSPSQYLHLHGGSNQMRQF